MGNSSAMRWPPIGQLWEGIGCLVIGCGPSLTTADVERVRQWRFAEEGSPETSRRVAVLNRTYEITPWADLLYACDGKFWETYSPDFAGLKVSQDARAAKYGAAVVPSVDEPGMSFDPSTIHQGGHSGHQVWNLLMLMGVSRLVLLGFDLSVEQGLHWHGAHPAGLNNPDASTCLKWLDRSAAAARDLAVAGVQVVNCSRETALTCFPRMTLENGLDWACTPTA